MRLPPQETAGTRGRDRALKRGLDRLGFALLRHDRNHPTDAAERGDGERDRVSGHGVEVGKMAFAHLLPAAFFVELHQLDRLRVGKVGPATARRVCVWLAAYAGRLRYR